jgi:hypothetical protein
MVFHDHSSLMETDSYVQTTNSPDDQKLQGTPNMIFSTFSDSQTEKNYNYWESEKVEKIM